MSRPGRRFIGIELSEQYADGIRKRLQQIEFGAGPPTPAKRTRASRNGHAIRSR